MAKRGGGLGKFLLFCIGVGAAVGAYIYMNRRDKELDRDIDDDFDNFEDETELSKENRKYINLEHDKIEDAVKETAENAADAMQKAAEDAAGKAEKAADKVTKKVEEVKETTESFFDDTEK